MILLTRNHLETEMPYSCRQQGWYKISKYKADNYGNPILETEETTGWFPNLITNQGLNRLGTSLDVLSACQVGSGTAVPAFTDTGLQTFVAGTTTTQSVTTAAAPSPPYFGSSTITYRFAAGAATGNLSEVGTGWAATGSVLFSRALIVDTNGNPITITVLSNEVLDVTYQLRNFPNSNDVVSNITITGVGTRNLTTRPVYVTSGTFLRAASIGGISTSSGLHIAYNGPIGPITAEPSGANSGADSVVNNTYVNNSLQRTSSFTFGLNSANLAGGIRSVRVCFGVGGAGNIWVGYQSQFDAVINKLNTQTFTLNTLFNWGRL